MAKNTINDKSKQISIRIPHDVMDDMEALKREDESNAGFIVTAMRGEIARRQSEGGRENPLLSSLDALARIKEIGDRAGKEIDSLINVAESELQIRKSKG